MLNWKLFGERIGQKRIQLHMTQQRLADSFDTTQKHISLIENAKVRPSPKLALDLLKWTRMDIEELFHTVSEGTEN